LKKYGYYNLSIPDKSIALEHPDSHIPFEGYSIPYMKDAIELCTKAHRLLFFNFLVGWDVAITDEGPIIVEANEKPGMNIVQAMDGGLKAKISQYASHTS
ncbi:MAG TPA: sugar-transfer associated ATP-grasp domain-containing protein, partial [Candidatus Cloacimonadota bacterium]|nr:sugar-transfer associated ATP-grasp domain-containing protein [Candidatus Cloacimonadota bacterium]